MRRAAEGVLSLAAAGMGLTLGLGCSATCLDGALDRPYDEHEILEAGRVELVGGTARDYHDRIEVRYRKADGTGWRVRYAKVGWEAAEVPDSGDSAPPADTGDAEP